MRNYWETPDFTIFTKPFIYLDIRTEEDNYLADKLFGERNIRIKFHKKEMMFKESPMYKLVFCKVNKKDVKKFEEAMEQLKNNILLLGYTEYEKICALTEKVLLDM